MQKDNFSKYQDNPLGLPPSFLDLCEALRKTIINAAQEQSKRERQIEDVEYEVIEPKQLQT